MSKFKSGDIVSVVNTIGFDPIIQKGDKATVITPNQERDSTDIYGIVFKQYGNVIQLCEENDIELFQEIEK